MCFYVNWHLYVLSDCLVLRAEGQNFKRNIVLALLVS